MKISNVEVNRIRQAVAGGQEEQYAVVQGMARNPAELEHVSHLLDSVPEVRSEMVEQLLAQTEDGTYAVTGEEIADLMVRRAVADSVR